MYGFIDAGIGITVQWTELDTIYDLEGASMAIGGGGNAGWVYAGADMLYVGDDTDKKKSPDGMQFNMGVGVGMDIHIIKSNTLSLHSMAKEIVLALKQYHEKKYRVKASRNPNNKNIRRIDLLY